MNSFVISNIVRNHPLKDGSFETFEIEGIDHDVLTVRNTEGICETETWTMGEVELYTFKGNCGSYSIGDTVRVLGYDGKWNVEHFSHDYRSSSQGEWNVSLLHEDGHTRLFYPAHFAKKA